MKKHLNIIKKGVGMDLKKEVFILCFIVLIFFLPSTVLADLTGYAAIGTINQSDNTNAHNASVTLHSTALGEGGESFRCNCSDPGAQFTSGSGIYATSVDDLVADYDCPSFLSQGAACAAYINASVDYVWITVDGSTVIPTPQGNGSTSYGTTWDSYPRSGLIYQQIDAVLSPLPTPPRVNSTNQTGAQEVDVFNLGEKVYATGSGFVNNSNVTICVVNNNDSWTDGMEIPQNVSCNDSVAVRGDGTFGPVFLWNGSIVGGYDIVVDQDRDGYYNYTRDGIDSATGGGFYIYPEPLTAVMVIAGLSILYGFTRVRRKS